MTANTSAQVRWTIADLEGLPENSNRYEIINGELFVTRAPHLYHQNVIGKIYAVLLQWSLASGTGMPFIGPGIIFSEADAVIPDLIWASNEKQSTLLDDAGHLTGAPELIVEVLSNTAQDKRRDKETKLKLYSVQGVSEYWIADREQKLIEVYRRENAMLQKAATLFAGDFLTSPLLPDFSCEVDSIFK